ncbi:hypothetical protein Pla123a_31350 [Posidoniimonas polymericola]|uniref:ORC1/DEAH AAA+ ATPase domain-containing protein n=1 Tax=Posidoniimonas polymericola TaxID=2528002 RepID=A0A5C5YL20_9BACT|nr:AAA family ATPase [Posidoniimonas polymericola]TWT75625.1 hypothetical protein Pla123a_31350 [Posidoniimonas polymericola]
MYLQHWRLDYSPFRTTIDAERAYPSEALRESTARIEYLIAERRRVGVLLGERGAGKSVALAVMQRRLQQSGAAACVVDAFGLSRRELLWQVAEGIQAEPDPTDDEGRLWRRLSDRAQHLKWQGRDAVLMVDDVEQLGADLMRQLVRLLRIDPAPDSRWTVILATDPARLSYLDDAVLHAIDLRIDLYPWTLDDTTGYLQNALFEAGRLTPIFDDEAILRLFELTTGVPRHVVRLADFALLAGAGAGADSVDAGTVEQAFEEISWSPPVAAG